MNVNLLCGIWYPAGVPHRNEAFQFPVKSSCCQSLFIQNVGIVGGPKEHVEPALMVSVYDCMHAYICTYVHQLFSSFEIFTTHLRWREKVRARFCESF